MYYSHFHSTISSWKLVRKKPPESKTRKHFLFLAGTNLFFSRNRIRDWRRLFFSLMEFSKRKRGSSSRAESRVKFWQKELLQQSLYGSPNGEMRMATGRWMGKNRGGEIDSSSTYFTKVCVCMYVRRTGDNRFFFSPNNDDLRVHVL